MFQYAVYLSAMNVPHMVPYNISHKHSLINAETASNRRLDLSDPGGFTLNLEDVLFLCYYPGTLSLIIELDSTHLLSEAHEGNNQIAIHGLSFNNTGCER